MLDDIDGLKLYNILMFGYGQIHGHPVAGDVKEVRKQMSMLDLYIDDEDAETPCPAYTATMWYKKVLALQLERNISCLFDFKFDGETYFAPMPLLHILPNDYYILESKLMWFYHKYQHLNWQDKDGPLTPDDKRRTMTCPLYVEPKFDSGYVRAVYTSALDHDVKLDIYATKP